MTVGSKISGSGQCACEQLEKSQKAKSPGVVLNREEVVRHIYQPMHVNADDGKLMPGAFPKDDLKSHDLGVSLTRTAHVPDGFAEGELRARKEAFERKGKSLASRVGLARAIAGNIRDITHKSDHQIFCIWDDAEPDNEGHALMAVQDREETPAGAVRFHLLELFELDPVDLEAKDTD